jgi:hypothetical protein
LFLKKVKQKTIVNFKFTITFFKNIFLSLLLFGVDIFAGSGIIIYEELKEELLMRTQDIQNLIGIGLMTVGLMVFIVLIQILEVIQ